MERWLLSLGELRAEHLSLFSSEEPVDMLLAAPAHLGSFEGLDRIHDRPTERIPVSMADAFREALLGQFVSQIDRLPQNVAWADRLQRWAAALEGGRARCFLRADAPVFTRLLSGAGRTLLGAAPLVEAWARQPGRGEPQVELTGSEHQRVRDWLQQQLDRSEDISGTVAGLLRASWAGPSLTPLQLYYRVLVDYFAGTVGGKARVASANPVLDQLTDFQVEAYQFALGILRRYGGVFLSDVVGLGKTYIALAILRHYQEHHGEHAVLVAPPNVIPTWQRLAAELRVELQAVSLGKLSDLEQHEDRELLVVDESHHFRNRTAQRYDQLQTWLRPGGEPSRRKVLLLSATPQNNSALDVKHQLQLFPDNFTRLPFTGESLDAWFKEVERGQSQLADLLQHVVVRRTRRFIRSAYPDAKLREKGPDGRYRLVALRFPERRSGPDQCLRYAIDDSYPGGLYRKILGTLAKVKLAPYALATYLTDAGGKDSRVSGIRRAGQAPRGLIRMLLLKRLESSMVAFRSTLGTLQGRYRTCLEDLGRGKVTVRVRPGGEADDAGIEEQGEEERQVPSALFNAQQLGADLGADLALVSDLAAQLGALDETRDIKADRLVRYLEERFASGGRKAIVFTQFADTAKHLGMRLGQSLARTAVVTSAMGNALEMARRFAPVASRAVVPAAEHLDLLVSTDTLGEGVNLQDADTLVNYDLHWNPVRLIQRAGRIDRIGSAHDVIEVASFLPEGELERNLGMEAVLRRRIQEFLKVFGEDSHVLPSDERLDENAALHAYTGAALEETPDAMDGLSRHVERLLQWKGREPQAYEEVRALRPGRHAISALARGGIAAGRLGWFWRFYRRASDGNVEEYRDDLDALDALWAHAEAGPGVETPAVRAATGAFVDAARHRFETAAAILREQRARPRLSGAEEFVRQQLNRFRRDATDRHRARADAVEKWLLGGHAQAQVRRHARVWQQEALSPEEVFLEARSLMERFPAVEESLGEVEMIGAVCPQDAGAPKR